MGIILPAHTSNWQFTVDKPDGFPYDARMSTDRKEICVSLPLALLAEVDLFLHDPDTGKPAYGARSQLIASLLEGHLNQERLKRNGLGLKSTGELFND
jgi:hypothetical protein